MASKGSTPPYQSAARISDSQCFPQYSASLKCSRMEPGNLEFGREMSKVLLRIVPHKKLNSGSPEQFAIRLEEFNTDKSKCQEHFDVYKECKKKEREARLERNKSRSLFS